MLISSVEEVWMTILFSAMRKDGVSASAFLLLPESEYDVRLARKGKSGRDKKRRMLIIGKSMRKLRSFLKIRG